MSTVATGNSTLVALAPELRPGVPSALANLNAYTLIPSANLDLADAESESGETTGALGQPESVPGPIGDEELEMQTRFSAETLLEPLGLMAGSVVKTEVETGAFRYVITPTLTPTVASSFFGLVAKEPVQRHWLHELLVHKLEAEIGDNEEVPAKLTAMAARRSELGWPVADGGNTGTYAYTPVFRGPLLDETAGPISVQVSSVSPFRWRVAQGATPVWTGPEVEVRYDEDGFAYHEICRGADGADLGIVEGDNYDPLEIIWPGKAADHALLAVGDTWQAAAPGSWVAPTVTRLGGGRRLSAHWEVKVRNAGTSDAWVTVRAESGSVSVGLGLKRQGGAGSRYASRILRKAPAMLEMGVEADLLNDFFRRRYRRRQRLDVEMSFLGEQIGTTGDLRSGLVFAAPYAGLTERSAEIDDVEELTETVSLMGFEPPTSYAAPPWTVTVWTSRDWALPTYLT